MKNILAILCLTGILLCLFVVSFGANADQTLKDKYGRTVGTIRVHPDGKQLMQDKYGQTVGSYSPKFGKEGATYDKYGRMIGTGNQLILTLPSEDKK